MIGLNATLNSVVEECESLDSWSSWVFGEEVTLYQRYRCGLVVPLIVWFQSVVTFFLSFQKSDLFVLVFLYCLAHTFRSTVHRLVSRRVVPLWYSARGICVIRGEAMQPGSSFRLKTDMPRCQVPIYTPGVMYDTFLGYGIRYDDILVLPTHVYASADNGLLIKTEKDKSFLLEATPIMSEILTDVCYFMLDKSVWVRLGFQCAKVTGAPISPVAVTVVGPQGASSGFVSRNSTPYILNYTGSTIPGYSGAPYVSNGSVIGIHAGETNGMNVGYGMGAIAMEISVLVYGEDFEDYVFEGTSRKRGNNPQFAGAHWKKGGNNYKPKKEGKEQPWRDTDVAKNVKKAQGRAPVPVDWDNMGTEDTFDYDQEINFDSARTLPQELVDAFSDYSVAQLDAIRNYLDGLTQVQKTAGIRMRPHGVDSFDFVDVEADEDGPTSYVVSWKEKMEERVTKLELQLASLLVRENTNLTGKKIHPFACSKCEKTFKSKLGKVSHELTKHPEIQMETAIRGDEKVEVGTTSKNFLGRGQKPTSMKPSAPKKKSYSKPSSPSSIKTVPSIPKETSQSKTPISRKDIEQAFDGFQKVIFGLLEERKQ